MGRSHLGCRRTGIRTRSKYDRHEVPRRSDLAIRSVLQSILTLCLLLFVCFAIRPMGLSYTSRIFGVSLGLGIMATTDLVQSAVAHPEARLGKEHL